MTKVYSLNKVMDELASCRQECKQQAEKIVILSAQVTAADRRNLALERSIEMMRRAHKRELEDLQEKLTIVTAKKKR